MKIFLLVLNLTVLVLAIQSRSFAQSNEPPNLINQINDVLRQRYGREIRFTVKVTESGDTATGEEIFRSEKTLTIDTTPCGPEPHAVVYFVKQWKENQAADLTCDDGKKHRQLDVTQGQVDRR